MNWAKRNIMAFFSRVAMSGIVILGGIFVSTPSSSLMAGNTVTVSFRPIIQKPPAPVTDLTAVSGGAGQMMLQWSAPDENNDALIEKFPVVSYQVKIATFSIDSLGGSTNTWWNAALDVSGEPIPSIPGSQDSLLLNSFTQGVTYWAALISTDD